MTSLCNFDSLTGISGSDCLKACVDSGCIEEALGNGECDEECARWECGWDAGDCGSCSLGCKSQLGEEVSLGNSACEVGCNSLECGWDGGDCGSCSPGCFAHMVNNGHCDLACLTLSCQNDGSDCLSSLCHTGCFPHMKGNSQCDSECDNAECQWDSGDCDCSPNCHSSMLANTICDFACNTSACLFDNFQCGDCASECFSRMIGDHNCDPACNTAPCQWDGLDCGCAPGCSESDYGTCKAECLVPACNYDRMNALSSCQSAVAKAAAAAYHSITGSFELVYKHNELCLPAAPGCPESAWLFSLSSCVADCAQSLLCLGSFGQCSSTCPVGCSSCVSGDRCLACQPGFYLFYSLCVQTCPLYYSPAALIPSLCVPNKDSSTSANPHVYYVSSSGSGLNPDGSFALPFPSLSHAFAAAFGLYSCIRLFPGTHSLTALLPSARFHSIRDSSLYPSPPAISIVLEPAGDDPPQLLYDNLYPVELVVSGHLTLSGLNLTALSTLVPDCSEVRCTYCPWVHRTASGYVDDKGKTIVAFAQKTACAFFHGKAFIVVNLQASLNVIGCNFLNFRQEFASLISFSDANVTISNTLFRNITTQTAIVTKAPTPSFSSFLSLSSSTFEYLGNGYEYKELQWGGVLKVQDIWQIEVQTVTVRRNIVGNWLFDIGNCENLTIQNSSFRNNVGGIVRIKSDAVVEAALLARNLTHIAIISCQFRNNSESSLSIALSGSILNTLVRNCSFANLISLNLPLMSITISREVTAAEMLGGDFGILQDNTKAEVSIPRRYFRMLDLLFANCSTQRVLALTNVPNLLIGNLSIVTCGDLSGTRTLNTDVLSGLIGRPEIYLSLLPANMPSPQCAGLIALTGLFNAMITGSNMTGNRCVKGTVGVVGSQLAGAITISESQFVGNVGNYSLQGTVLDLSGSGPLILFKIAVLNNLHGSLVGKGIVAIRMETAGTLVSTCTFSSNVIPDGGSLNVAGNLVVQNSQFSSNQCSGSTAAGLIYSPSTSGAQLTITGSSFSRNRATVGAAVLLYDQAATRIAVSLQVLLTVFELNVSQGLGSCVLLDASISLSTTSLISQSRFANNSAANGSLAVSFASGYLLVDKCVFEGNTGLNAAAVFGNQPRSTISSLPCLIHISNSVFDSNSGFSIISFNNPDRYTEGKSTNLTLIGNTGRGIYLQYTYWTDVNSTFLRNYSPSSGPTFIIHSFSVIIIRGGRFIGNLAKLTGGTMTLSILARLTIEGSSFEENAAERGGVLYVEVGATLIVTQSKFLRNTSNQEGAVGYFFTGPLTSANSSITDSYFQDNVSKRGAGVLSLTTSLLIVQRVQFVHNQAPTASGFLLYISTLTLLDCSFRNQTSAQGTFITSTVSSINVTNCTFEQGSADAKGGAIYVASSSLWISTSRFVGLRASVGAAIAAFAASKVTVSATEFTNLRADQIYGGAIFLSETSFQDMNSFYSTLINGAIVAQSSNVFLSRGLIEQVESLSGAGLYCLDCSVVRMETMTLRNLTGKQGACVHLVHSLSSSHAVIWNSEFTASMNGSFLLESVSAEISASRFATNSAENGAALVLTCELDYKDCEVTVSNTVFENNTATHNGGAIYWTKRKPLLANVTFARNKAQYGPNIASFPVSLQSNFTSLSNVASGQVSNSRIEAWIVDHYGQVVSTETHELADITPFNSALTALSGNIHSESHLGLLNFSGFTVTAQPGSQAQLVVSTAIIDPAKVVQADLEIPYSPSLVLTAYMRDCVPGESLLAKTCYVCPEGRYSLNASLPCQDCPKGAVCYGNYTMAPSPGYWRASANSDVFWACPRASACLGSLSTDISLIGECAKGYYGNMCNGCVSGFSRKQSDECALCPNDIINGIEIAAILLAGVIICVFIIKMSLLSAHRQQSQSSIFLKILVNYIQLTAVSSQFNMNWPHYALSLFNVQDNVSKVSMQLFSMDCFLDNGSSEAQRDAYYKKMVFIATIPIGILAVSVLFWGSMAIITQAKGYIKYQMLNSVVVLFFIAHPSIITFMFDAFNCRSILPGEYWLHSYLNIRCWDTLHSRYAMLVALPSLLLWGVCVPLLALIVLVARKKRLVEPQMRIRFGFLYTGYEGQKYYWEFVIMYRKMIIITLTVFLVSVSSSIQVLCVLIVLVVAYLMQVRSQPYNIAVFNQLEKRSITVAALTIYCGLFYMSEDLDEYTQALLFALIVLVNAYFLLYWVVQVCGVVWRFAVKRLPCLRKLLLGFSYLSSPTPLARVTPSAAEDPENSFSVDRSLDRNNRALPPSDKSFGSSFEAPHNSMDQAVATPTIRAITDAKK